MNTTIDGFLAPYLNSYIPWLYIESYWWTVLGFAGTSIFGSRFVIQWLVSEKKKQLVVPAVFWHLSFWGSVLNLIYFLHIDKAPPIFGAIFLPVLYARNLMLMGKRKNG